MWRFVVGVLVVCWAGACNQAFGIPDITQGSPPDGDAGIAGSPDALPPPDAPPTGPVFCYGSAPISICFAAAPTGAQGYSGTIDTGSSFMCATDVVSGGDGLCVLAAGSITLVGTLRATGTKPLVLLATDSIDVGSVLDVGSHRGMTPESGAGADPAACSTMAGTAPTSGGGGAGGSFVGLGGAGAVSAVASSTGGSSGTPVSLANLAPRGGCPGQHGQGTGSDAGGHGGGAVLLIASSITIENSILAGGEGGSGGNPETNGGGGGGAGGMIWFDASTVTNTGNNLILANSGAGGEGGGAETTGQTGMDGNMVGAAVGGRNVSINGGSGGNGSATTAGGAGGTGGPGGTLNASLGGGGGGGGGAGIVKARMGAGVNLGTKVSPAMTPQ